MKAKILSVIVAAMFCMANIALAANNPFDDVPANHWAYAAVNQLAKAGVIDGYGNGTFQGDKTLTRYEMAVIVGKAISHSAKADAENKALINKLSVEFKDELTNLGVRVDKLEKKSDKLTVNGFLHVSNQSWRNTGVYHAVSAPNYESPHANDGQWWSVGIDLYATYKVNDNWKILIEDEATRDFQSGGFYVNDANRDANTWSGGHNDQMYAFGKVGNVNTKIGKFEYQPGYGIVIRQDQKAVQGVQFAFGDPGKVKTILTYGYLRRIAGGNNSANPYIVSNTTDNRYTGAEVNIPLAKDANFKAAYHRIKNDENITATSGTVGNPSPYASEINLWEVGADKMIAKNLKLFGTYSQSNADEDNKAYLAGLTYGRMDLKKPGSYGVTARYVHWDKFTGYGHGYWASGYLHGMKGPELFTNIAIDKNVAIFAWCDWVKPADGTKGSINTV
ncbi:S-layer homology domain-containing protein, partial [Sporomusa acidovorans]|uniref:S-layer homology domain-containing protein n=1 Tax=Sporomusa acidovorans TaxID=112900 RepID=UPI0008887DF4